MRTVAVIGGGAAGMMAAVTASQNGADVILLEHKDRLGKKILSTGNGRCNFTNIRQEPGCYHSDDPEFPWKVVEQFDARSIISFFLQLGVYSKNRNGYIYPNSDQASAVLDALRMEVERLGIDVRTGTECREIRPGRKGFAILTDRGVPVLPALVQLRCGETFFKSIAGIRAEGTVSILVDGQCIASDRGEIQLTNYGISGIPVFQVSRYASRLLYEKREVRAVLDFMPDFTQEQMLDFLRARADARPQKKAEQFLIGLFHKKLSDLWIRLAGIPREKAAGSINEEEMERLIPLIKNFTVSVTGTNSYDQAQVCCGGVDTAEVDPCTMGSRYVPGLYFAGELLDVDGMCGGYNLTFAWASGYIAGRSAAE